MMNFRQGTPDGPDKAVRGIAFVALFVPGLESPRAIGMPSGGSPSLSIGKGGVSRETDGRIFGSAVGWSVDGGIGRNALDELNNVIVGAYVIGKLPTDGTGGLIVG